MKKVSVVIFALLLVCITSWAQRTEVMYVSGQDINDNVIWDFYCTEGRNSGKWTKIRVPSCWEMEGFGKYNYGHDVNKGEEKGLYKTEFSLPREWKGRRLYIVFEGSMTDTRIKVNGKQAGDIHQGAFYRFKREITDLVSYTGKNQLEVEVSKMSTNKSVNEAERSADFWVFGGIFRPVYIEAVPQKHIEYIAIDARHDGNITANIVLDKAYKEINASLELYHLKTHEKVGEVLSGKVSDKTITLSGHIVNVLPWSAEHPNLYEARIIVRNNKGVLHVAEEKIGFRTIEVKERDGIYVNGKRIMFKGVNRHCFWPTTGRTVPRQVNLDDALKIKDMNMNAVRMSHYPPDKYFLEICDSLGLYVIDELCAWQHPPYDTQVGTILAQEMVKRDVNHPSIIFWSNGNEGGFNYDLDPIFPALDLQKRPLLHPWGLYSGINTVHYIHYNSGIKNMFNGRDIFMPTELLHGLYDGGHGAGLDDYWNAMLLNPLSAGLFLWDFADQGIVRTDLDGILDTDKDHAADGIVGPYREKEGSYYTIKEIWSPIQLEKKYITSTWDGTLNVENRYDFTNANQCRFCYKMIRVNSMFPFQVDSISGIISAPDVAPGAKGQLKLDLPREWQEYDILYLSVEDFQSHELFTWSFELHSPEIVADRILTDCKQSVGRIELLPSDTHYLIKTVRGTIRIDNKNGLLDGVEISGKKCPLTKGPLLITDHEFVCKDVRLEMKGKEVKIYVEYAYSNGKRAYEFVWTVFQSGLLQLDYTYRPGNEVEMAGITFDFPENGIAGAELLAKGPYRVYNNRMKGGRLGLWSKTYNNTLTGESWDYPEFKGYYALLYGVKLNCETPFEVYSATEDITLHLFTPGIQQKYPASKNYTNPRYPKGNISFMDAIPSVGTKFSKAENYGPQSQKHSFKGYSGLNDLKGQLFFRF